MHLEMKLKDNAEVIDLLIDILIYMDYHLFYMNYEYFQSMAKYDGFRFLYSYSDSEIIEEFNRVIEYYPNIYSLLVEHKRGNLSKIFDDLCLRAKELLPDYYEI